jgi:hypothetical protein
VNSQELEAYGELAKAITRHIYDDALLSKAKTQFAELHEIEGPIYYCSPISSFETAVCNLLKLEVLSNIGALHGVQFAYFSLNCSVSNASTLAKQNWRTGPTFFELLSAFVGLYGYYHRETGFSIDRTEPFQVDQRIKSALDAIAVLGYATKTEKGYVWTELVAPAMYENCHWPNYTDETA